MWEVNQLKAREKKQQDASRKAETRTKIQLGGLVLKSEFAEKLGIEVGDDLQLDLTKRESTEMLLGALVDMKDRLDQDPSLASSWSALGQTWFAKHL